MKLFLVRDKKTDLYWGLNKEGYAEWVSNVEQAILKKREDWDSYFLEHPNMFDIRNICYYRRGYDG